MTNVREDGELSERSHQSMAPAYSPSAVTLASSWSSPLYATLYEGEFKGWQIKVTAGVRYRGNLGGGEIKMDFTFQIGDVSFELWSVSLSRGEDGTLCGKPKTHPAVPIEVEPCIDVHWSGGTAVQLGGSIDVCTVDACGSFADCQVCKGIGISRWIDFGELV
ncbi:hypothetical protein HT576_19480 [Haloterrigena sp. SYSU A121-1]|uniref:Uncharacterized protein n=1 Tax=Haloterrigena gelatinilytica TaxID=2741724 RepID=A0A8J8KH54_9EURY|nr:hypothetical protein [Haloterrigena gelatinilytica]NUB93191.1 hypothetical protein [Haloterrigena gelatinilytica]